MKKRIIAVCLSFILGLSSTFTALAAEPGIQRADTNTEVFLEQDQQSQEEQNVLENRADAAAMDDNDNSASGDAEQSNSTDKPDEDTPETSHDGENTESTQETNPSDEASNDGTGALSKDESTEDETETNTDDKNIENGAETAPEDKNGEDVGETTPEGESGEDVAETTPEDETSKAEAELDENEEKTDITESDESSMPELHAGNSISTATSISLGQSYSGRITESNSQDYYRFTLSTSGMIRLRSTAYMQYLNYKLFDSAGEELWSTIENWNGSTEQISLDETKHLTSGTYYLAIERNGERYGNYSFSIAFTSAGETFKETKGGIDNSLGDAHSINMGTTYKGQIALNDDRDFYKFSLSTSGALNISSIANMQYLNYYFYDDAGNELWSTIENWNGSTEQIVLNKTLYFTSGTYYLGIVRNGSRYGNYNFKLTFSSSGESFKETNGGNNNTLSSADSISLNTDYKGQIAINDEKDFYKFNLPASDKISISINAKIEYLYYKIFDASGNEVWSESSGWNSSTGTISKNYSVELSSGTYYLIFERNGSRCGNYSFKIISSIVQSPGSVSGLKIGGRAANALRLNWNRSSNASGYIIEQYKSGKWTRIAKLENANTLTYRVEGLSASTTYQFRVRAFRYNGNSALYSGYSYVNGKTNPSVVTGVKIGGRATDALRINWSRNSKASGYIIEQYKSGKWSRIARIANNSTVTYRIEGLSASTKYQFRVQAFGYDGNTALYSAYTTISGTTLPTTVSGLKIGGTASDALRLTWNRNSKASGYIIEQYKSGKWTRIARIGNNSTVTYRVEGLSPSTTYNFRVQAFAYDGSTPIYSSYKQISGKTLSAVLKVPGSVTGLKIGGRAADALRLNWKKSVNASGYIVEQYKNGAWTRIARIGSSNTLTYRVEKLSGATTYKFRMKSFGYSGSSVVYSGYTYINGKTNPNVVSGLRIGGTANNALRLNWNKNSKASGYIIEQYKDGIWLRIARIGVNSTLTYRVTNLKPSTAYVFRVQSFAYDQSTPIYSGWQYVTGMTTR